MCVRVRVFECVQSCMCVTTCNGNILLYLRKYGITSVTVLSKFHLFIYLNEWSGAKISEAKEKHLLAMSQKCRNAKKVGVEYSERYGTERKGKEKITIYVNTFVIKCFVEAWDTTRQFCLHSFDFRCACCENMCIKNGTNTMICVQTT